MTAPHEPPPITSSEAREIITELRDVKKELPTLTKRGIWNRRFIAALAVLALGLGALAAVIWLLVDDYNETQDCRSARSAKFFAADIARVEGQVEGLKQLRNATTKADATAGFDKFFDASANYLTVIRNIKDQC